MATLGINHFENIDDGIGGGKVAFTDILVNTGALISLSKGLFASFAIILSPYEFKFHYIHGVSYGQTPGIDDMKFIPQKVGYNVTVGWRFGGSKN